MAKCSNNKFYKLLYGSIAVIALFIVQVFAGKAGGAVFWTIRFFDLGFTIPRNRNIEKSVSMIKVF